MRCEECKYFVKPDPEPHESPEERDEKYEVGDCHRFPAHVTPQCYGFDHPNVYRDDWCGEFQERKK